MRIRTISRNWVIILLFIVGAFSACAAKHLNRMEKGVWLLLESGYDADFSPDGSTIIYTNSLKGRPWKEDLNSYNMQSGDKQTILRNGFWDGEARYSPDGSQILFTTDMAGFKNLSILKVGSDSVEELTKAGAYHPSWSPDGKRIVFVSDRSGDEELWIYDLDVHVFQQLTHLGGTVATPSWSPDDSCIVFCFTTDDQWDLWSVSLPDGTPVPLFKTVQNECYPRWSRSGNYLVFSSFISSGAGSQRSSTIWLMKVEKGRCVGDVERIISAQEDGEKLLYPVLSPDQNLLVYATSKAEYRWDLAILDLRKRGFDLTERNHR